MGLHFLSSGSGGLGSFSCHGDVGGGEPAMSLLLPMEVGVRSDMGKIVSGWELGGQGVQSEKPCEEMLQWCLCPYSMGLGMIGITDPWWGNSQGWDTGIEGFQEREVEVTMVKGIVYLWHRQAWGGKKRWPVGPWLLSGRTMEESVVGMGWGWMLRGSGAHGSRWDNFPIVVLP